MTLPDRLTDVQLGKAPLPAGQSWMNQCPSCPLMVQGGHDGLEAHRQTVHPQEVAQLPL